MFTLSELASLSETHTTHRILKPWWDVFMEYLVFAMLMVSIFSGTLLISNEQVVCLPMDQADPANDSSTPNPTATPHTTSDTPTPTPTPDTNPPKNTADPLSPPVKERGRPTNLDYQQYVYISQVCYHMALPWYSRYFPYMALIHSLILLVSSNFWFKFPKTSSKVEHFIGILGKCFESPWTSKALSETACEDSSETSGGARHRFSTSSTARGRASEEWSPGTPLLARAGSFSSNLGSPPQESPVPAAPSATAILDRKDGEQAKALFEKVRKFRQHTEDTDHVYRVYVCQTVFKVFKFLLIVGYTSSFVDSISFEHVCRPQIRFLTGYSRFFCTHSMAFMLHKLLLSYVLLVSVYGLIGVYTLFWIFRRSLRQYSFEKVREESSIRDVPDVRNDFAFLLHMADQYDQLYSKRFAVFLSEVSEHRLLEENLNHEWGYDKLRQHVSQDALGRAELRLSTLSGIPKAVFEMPDLQVLKLELIPEARLPAKLSQMSSLCELHLCHCPAKVEPLAFNFLRDRLRSLHVRFTDVGEIPPWVYSLRALEELSLTGNLSSDNNRAIGLESLRELRSLKSLNLKSNLTKIPSGLVEVAGHLTRLSVRNDGTRLLVLNNLKRAGNLSELELLQCQLERIPHAVFSLTGLQSLDLRGNSIRSVEEVVSLQHLRGLACLRLCHNQIAALPPTLCMVRKLEQLCLSHNLLQSLPPALFTLKKLRHLDLAYNLLATLPGEIGELELLSFLSVSGNKLEALPGELFRRCARLRTLCLANNSLTSLPPEIGLLSQLSYLDLRGNGLERLPVEVSSCGALKKEGLCVEDRLFNTLPSEAKERLQLLLRSDLPTSL
ncbi:UNVERIFIED_CONTAM: hypothetical protein FKN15_057333 [Acipenser sinensis]